MPVSVLAAAAQVAGMLPPFRVDGHSV